MGVAFYATAFAVDPGFTENKLFNFRNGAPRPMKMGNIVSLWRYDVAIRHAIQLAKLRRPAIPHYASRIHRYCGVVQFPLKSDQPRLPPG
jgi:hypothetical protein